MRINNLRNFLLLACDILVLFAAFPVALMIRYESVYGISTRFEKFYVVCGVIFVFKLTFYFLSRLSRSVWKHASIYELISIVRVIGFALLSSAAVLFFYNRMLGVPRSSFIIDFLLSIIFLGGTRLLARYISENTSAYFKKNKGKKTLIIGSQFEGKELFNVVSADRKSRYNVVGFIDEDPMSHGRFIQGVRVLGAAEDIEKYIEKYKVQAVFIIMQRNSAEIIRQITDVCFQNNIELKKLPSMNDIACGEANIGSLKPLKIEDILGRKSVDLDKSMIQGMLNEKVVLITGGGGSIGSELCRQAAHFKPKKIVIFEICEFFIYSIENELNELFSDIEIVAIVGDIRDKARADAVFQAHKPDVVIHAAAYKHVPLMEVNPIEAFKTNILGTKNIVDLAVKHKAHRFVMISTDKAVNPTNIMGATKRIAEMICKHAQKGVATKFMMVRFGNVMGSNGSVIPYFMKQIERGGPVTVTHPDITRFFMTIPEASQLVLQAAAMGEGGEVFVLEMGKPVKILDLAKDLIRLTGHDVDDIGIEYIGLRPGEKLYEEVLANEENTIKTFHSQVMVANTREVPSNFEMEISRIISNIETIDYFSEVKKIVPEYTDGKHLIRNQELFSTSPP